MLCHFSNFFVVVISLNLCFVESVEVNATFEYVPSMYRQGRKWVLMVDGDEFEPPERTNTPLESE